MTETKKLSDADAVLSSVRRIVTRQLTAEELGTPPPAISETRDDPEPQRLLLTPALRVEERPEPSAPAAEQPSARRRLEERIAELELAVGSAGGEFEPDGSELQIQHRPESVPWTKKPAPAPEPAREAPDEAPMAEDAAEEPVAAGADRPLPFPRGAEARIPPVTEEAPAVKPVANPAEGPEATEDQVDNFVIDEEALRDIVAEIVRSELQGELGERITRNVRKLVRREIHRALMTRDFS